MSFCSKCGKQVESLVDVQNRLVCSDCAAALASTFAAPSIPNPPATEQPVVNEIPPVAPVAEQPEIIEFPPVAPVVEQTAVNEIPPVAPVVEQPVTNEIPPVAPTVEQPVVNEIPPVAPVMEQPVVDTNPPKKKNKKLVPILIIAALVVIAIAVTVGLFIYNHISAVDVVPNPTGTISATSETTVLLPGETISLGHAVTPEHKQDVEFEWTSSNPAVCTVDANGLVTAISTGSSTLTVKVKSVTDTFVVTVKDDHDIDDGAVTLEATCTEKGEMTYSCKDCKYQYTEEIKAKGHSLSSKGTVTKEPTCEDKGEKVYDCADCDYQKKEKIDALGHDFNSSGKCKTCNYDVYSLYIGTWTSIGVYENGLNGSFTRDDVGVLTLSFTSNKSGQLVFKNYGDSCNITWSFEDYDDGIVYLSGKLNGSSAINAFLDIENQRVYINLAYGSDTDSFFVFEK